MSARETFLTDIKEIRRRAREHLSDGAVTQNYGGKVDDAIALLNHAVGLPSATASLRPAGGAVGASSPQDGGVTTSGRR